MNLVTLYSDPTQVSQQLDKLAEFVRITVPKATAAYDSFNDLRFQVGLAMLCAKELLALDSRQNLIPGAVHIPSSGHVSTRTYQGLTKVDSRESQRVDTDSTSNFQKEDAGLVMWAKREFPQISYKTLSRYRAYAEHKAIPALIKARSQLELPLDIGEDAERVNSQRLLQWVNTIDEAKRPILSDTLNKSADAKELALTLRAQGSLPGNPDHWGPTGGARKASPRRTKAAIALDDWNLRARSWIDSARAVFTDSNASIETQFGRKYYWDDLSDAELDAFKLAAKDLYSSLLECQQNRQRLARTAKSATPHNFTQNPTQA